MNTQGLIEPNAIFSFTVNGDDSATRIDIFISQQFPFYSRSFFKRLINEELISLNNKPVHKPSVKIQSGNVVTVQFPPKRSMKLDSVANNLKIDIIHEGEHFLIINKPAGLLVHPPSESCKSITLMDWIVHSYEEITNVGYVDRPGIVHRLDKDTSGILIVSRTNYAHTTFSELFKNRMINKTYYAFVKGHPKQNGTIDLPIGRHPHNKIKITTFSKREHEKNQQTGSNKTRHALTHYKVIEYFDDCSLVEVKPVTGRTHQIRVHFAAIGHPLIGDFVYGCTSKLINRQALHAQGLNFNFCNKEYSFLCDFPDDMRSLTTQLKKST